MALLKPSNYKGAAALHVVTKFRSISNKSVLLSKVQVGRVAPSGQSSSVMFRDCTLFPRCSICSGMTCNLMGGGVSGGAVERGIVRVIRLIKLGKLRRHVPGRLSKNRRRHITLTETLIVRPTILLFSRPLSGLSTGLQICVHGRVEGVRRQVNVADICIARSRTRTVDLSSGVVVVGGKRVRRIKAPRRMCRRPTSHFITSFVNDTGFIRTGIDRKSDRKRVVPIDVLGRSFGIRCTKLPIGTKSAMRVILHPRTVELTSDNSIRTRIVSSACVKTIRRCIIHTNSGRLRARRCGPRKGHVCQPKSGM